MMRLFKFWEGWGLVSRLMLAVGIAIVAGGSIQTFLFIAEGASEHSARLKRELTETLSFIAPLIADQALVGEYAAIDQLVKKQVTKGELDRFEWVDKDAAAKLSTGLLTAVERWRTDWQALDTPRYLQHYAPDFVSDTQRLPAWREQKIAVNAAKTWAKIELGNLSAVQYPGERNLAEVTFDQNYQSNNLSGQTRKRQLWQMIGGRWQIIYEGSA